MSSNLFNSNQSFHMSTSGFPPTSYHLTKLRVMERNKVTENKAAGKSCENCNHFTASCKCKLKGNKTVKPYNICNYHE